MYRHDISFFWSVRFNHTQVLALHVYILSNQIQTKVDLVGLALALPNIGLDRNSR